jgi:hypothetical protein
MFNPDCPSLAKFTAFVELKDFRAPTKKEYVRYVRKLGEHFACDPATLTEDQLRAYFLYLRQEKHYVLPKGFQRVRHYGWLGAAAEKKRARIAALLDWKSPAVVKPAPVPPPECPVCRTPMVCVARLPRAPP